MNRSARQRKLPSSPRRRPVLLVFGESENDRKAIVHLARGLRPDLEAAVEERRHPLVLIKNAKPGTARDNAREIAELARAEAQGRTVLGVLAHEDCDAREPAHITVAMRIEQSLEDAGCPKPVIAVTPAWEIEAWWMVFPEAVGRVVEGWRNPDDWLGKSVGSVTNAKEELARAVRPKASPGRRPREYAEGDSIKIAENIVRDDLLRSFDGTSRRSPGAHGKEVRTESASFGEFRRKLLAIKP